MQCKQCNHEIPNGAKYCAYCGNSQKESDGVSSTILFLFIIIFGSILSTFIVIDLIEPGFFFHSDTRQIIYYFLRILQVLSFLLIPFAFKKMKYRIISLATMGPFLLWYLYSNIKMLINLL